MLRSLKSCVKPIISSLARLLNETSNLHEIWNNDDLRASGQFAKVKRNIPLLLMAFPLFNPIARAETGENVEVRTRIYHGRNYSRAKLILDNIFK
ncbi:MAG TPA: hypothetical protein VFA61_01600 [Candidatus Udaeobacter sp.]|nr:hypothetical protein [Candidatus Udaeobacter sp.]